MSPSSASLADSFLPSVAFSAGGKYVSMALTLAVHLLLLAFLFYGVRWQTQISDAVEVELVRAVPESAPVAESSPAPKVDAREPKVEPKAVVKPVAPLPRPDIALKNEKNEKLKPKPVIPPVAQTPTSDPFQKQLDQELKRTAAERKIAEATNAASRELTEVKEAQAAAAKSKAMTDYIGKIRGRIKSNIILPSDIKGNPEAVFEVVQFPSGEILSVRLKRSSGHAGYDAAVERAILKSSPLPKPERGDLFERELNLKFHPLED